MMRLTNPEEWNKIKTKDFCILQEYETNYWILLKTTPKKYKTILHIGNNKHPTILKITTKNKTYTFTKKLPFFEYEIDGTITATIIPIPKKQQKKILPHLI